MTDERLFEQTFLERAEDAKPFLRTKSKSSLYFFAKFVLGFKDFSPRLHKPACEFLQEFPWLGGRPNSNRKLLVMPRDHFKSSMASIALPIWILLHNPNRTIALVSAKEDNTINWLRAIKSVFETNELFQRIFPEIIPDLGNPIKWDATQIIINRDDGAMPLPQASITATSIQSGQASQHYDDIINDDLVNEKTYQSPQSVAQAVELYKLQEALLSDWATATITNIGTPWAMGDPLEFMMEEEVPRGKMLFLKYSCYEPGGTTPIFPERFSQEGLEALEHKYGRRLFSFLYLCDPYDPGMGGFEAEWLRSYLLRSDGSIVCDCHPAHRHRVQEMTITMQVDPAYSDAEEAAESAGVINGIAPCECRFVLDYFHGHLNPEELVRKVHETAGRWIPWLRRVGIEAVSFQRVFKFWLDSLRRSGQSPLPGVEFVDLKPDKGLQKEVRIKGQMIPAQSGLWHALSTHQAFKHQFERFPRVRPVDILDAWAYCDQLWTVPAASHDGEDEDLTDGMDLPYPLSVGPAGY